MKRFATRVFGRRRAALEEPVFLPYLLPRLQICAQAPVLKQACGLHRIIRSGFELGLLNLIREHLETRKKADYPM